MIQRTIAVSSGVGAPFELISENPPPITRAATAMMPKTSETLRAVLQKKRECERSGRAGPGGTRPFTVGRRPATLAGRTAAPLGDGPGSVRNRTHWDSGTGA